MRVIQVLVLFALLGCGKIPSPEPDQDFKHFNGDFESASLNGFHLLVVDELVNTSIVSIPVRKGNYALKNTTRPDDYVNNGYRSELAIYNCARYKNEVYYAFSFMVDTNYSDHQFNLICQWQDLPNYYQGEVWEPTPVLHGASPPLALVYADGKVELKLNQNPHSNNETFSISNAVPVTKGLWNDMIFHIYWTDDNTAFVEAKMNGVYMTQFNGTDYKYYGKNLFNRAGNYFKFGQYRGKDKTLHTNIIYFDEVKVGSSMEEVAL